MVCVDFPYFKMVSVVEHKLNSHYILSDVEMGFIRGHAGIVLATHLFCGFVLFSHLRNLSHGFRSHRPQRASQRPG